MQKEYCIVRNQKSDSMCFEKVINPRSGARKVKYVVIAGLGA